MKIKRLLLFSLVTNFSNFILIGVLRAANLIFQVSCPLYLRFYFFYKEFKEKKNLKFLKLILNNKMNVVDVGANVGYFSREFSKILPNGKVYAVEPNPQLHKCLQYVARKHPQIEILTYALSDHNELGEMNFYPSNLLNIDGRSYKNQYSKKSIKVDTASFDTLFKNKPIDLIKIDTQGYEFVVLNGMKEFLKTDVILYLEFWPSGMREAQLEPGKLLEFIENYGFQIEMIKKDKIYSINHLNWEKYFDEKEYFSDSNIVCYKNNKKTQVMNALEQIWS